VQNAHVTLDFSKRGEPVGQLPVTDCSTVIGTLVAFHAHPDDETLFTGGTLARAAAQGHRTVLVTATLGDRGLTGKSASALDVVRRAELEAACAALGVSRLVVLGYGDSGMDSREPAGPGTLCAAPLAEVAVKLEAVLREESADVLTIYDAHGGYGHRDHIRVHDAGLLAARSFPDLRVFEATIPREPLVRVVRLLNRCGVKPGGMTAADLAGAYRSRGELTHTINVAPVLGQKLRALHSHASQTTGGSDIRTIKLLGRPLVARALWRREWFVEIDTQTGAALRPDEETTKTPRHGRLTDLFRAAS
jgi:LmbE family N-acetylglucosaminyl deacetylase